MPRGEDSDFLISLIKASKPILENMRSIINGKKQARTQPTLYGLGGRERPPLMPLFKDIFGFQVLSSQAVDLLKGIGKYAGP